MSNEIGKEIFRQLGGMKMVAMTGAKNMLYHPDGFSWKMPSNFAKNKINYVKVTLNSGDLYDIEFGYIRSLNYKVVSNVPDVFNDNLRDVIESETGLKLKLF